MASFMKEFEHLEIKLKEIKSATNNFNENQVIGHGGFGNVYEGELSHSQGKSMVAIKRLDRKYGQGGPEFLKEIRMLTCYKHENLISLLGFCKENDEMILIYEHASRRSLERNLKDATLTWKQRLNICLDEAKGISFLHDPNGTQQRIIHRDIKSANILLDESLNAKVADFGLSKISPANQKYTFLFTSPVGTPGYCDPLYMDTYQLTKESDVYSFGVVLFEVLCGRVCYEHSHGNFKVLIHFWKSCYEQKKLHEIIFPDLKKQMDPSSLKTFVDIAYQCLQKTREQRPTMSVVVEKLKAALELQEPYDLKLQREYEQEEMRIRKAAEYEAEKRRKAAEYAYREILKLADPPLIYKSVKELKALLSKGFPVNGGKTLLSINERREIIFERIYIEACLDPIQYDRLEDPSNFENSRFPGGRCYCKHDDELKVCVRAQFLCPLITYSVNLVFRNVEKMRHCKTLYYRLNGEEKCCMVYDTYAREDGWFVVPLYQFTSDHKTVDFEIYFKKFQYGIKIRVAGFEFRPLEEKVELHDQGFEEYQEILKAASQTLFYNSIEELKELLSIGFYINNYKKWFSLNENGEHCEMLSIANCLISREGVHHFHHTDGLYSRFPSGIYTTNKKGFKVHIRTHFLTPSIRYTVNLVICNDQYTKKQKFVALRYKLEGEIQTSIVYLATETKHQPSLIAELYQFTSNGRTFDIEIVFEDHKYNLEVKGILFQPIEKVEHQQVLKDGELSDERLQWTMCLSNMFKWFMGIGQKAYSVDNNGKKSLMFSARGVIRSDNLSFKSSPESRFGEVALITYRFNIKKIINCDALTRETMYACYLVYKSTEDHPVLENISENSYIYLVSPHTPIIGQKLDRNTQSPLNRPQLNEVPQQRNNGWMEVKVWQFRNPSFSGTIPMHISLRTTDHKGIRELIIESIEFRPIVAHST